jgi:chromosome segregation ATPase
MTRIGKILVVLIAVVSLAFAGFAMLIFYAGPNYREMAGQIEGYKFTLSSGENPTWSAVRARGDSQVASDKSLAKVIDAVLADKLKAIQDESTDYKNRIPPLTEELEKTKAANEADLPALTEYIAAQRTRLEALNAQVAQLQSQVLAETANAQKLENIASARRDDVFKLNGQLTEVRTDKFRLEAIKRQLAEELEQVIGNIERAEERQKKLEQDVKLGMGQAG